MFRELLNRAQQRLAELSLVQMLVGTLVDRVEQVAIKLAWAQPFIRSFIWNTLYNLAFS